MTETLRAQHEEFTETAKKMKEISAADSEEMLSTIVHGYRDGESVVAISCKPDRELMLTVLGAVLGGFSAQRASVLYEAYHTTHHCNPLTGEPWEPGEMGYVLENYPQAREEKWVEDSVNTMTINVNGDVANSTMGFTVDDGVVSWVGIQETWGGNLFDENGETQQQGPIPDALRSILDHAKKHSLKGILSTLMDSALTNDEEMRARIDCALAVRLQEFTEDMCQVALSADPGSRREEIIGEFFEKHDVLSALGLGFGPDSTNQ